MNAKQILAVSAVVLFALCLVPSVDADTYISSDPSETLEFDNLNGGNIPFSIYSDTSFTMDVSVVNRADDSVIHQETVQIRGGQNNNITLHVDGLEAGDYILSIRCSAENITFNGPSTFSVSVTVDKNILSNWATYAVIIIVVIVIAIFAYLKIRDTPKNKPEMTFEELEAQRKAEMAEKAEKRQKKEKTPAASTERKRYVGGSKTADAAPAEKPAKEKPVKEKKPKMTFEELEAQKQAEKAAKAEKKKSTGLTERERYLEEKRKKKEQE